MPSASAGVPLPPLPPELIPDHEKLEVAVRSWMDRAAAGGSDGPEGHDLDRVLSLLTMHGLLVHRKSAKLALIAKGDRPHVLTRHVLDSLNPLSLFPEPPPSALDAGSGAGFPGIPLAIVWPRTRFVLAESREKKAGFLESAVRELELPNVRVVCARLEDLRRMPSTERAGAVFVRAVAGLSSLLADAAAVAEEGARWCYFLGAGDRGRAVEREMTAAGYPCRIEEGAFGGSLLAGSFRASP